MESGLWMGLATIVAVLLGPVIAVLASRHLDHRRADKTRKMDIFRALMRTRGMRLGQDHVEALNLVEVEFVGHPSILEAWNNYLSNLGEELPPAEQKHRFDAAVRRRDALLTTLIYEIANAVGIRVQQLDILDGNYVPQGWQDTEWEHQLARRGLINVLYGKTAISIIPRQSKPEESPYPPPPDV